MNLCFDFGNTYGKLAIFDKQTAKLLHHQRFSSLNTENLQALIQQYQITQAIYASVTNQHQQIITWLARQIPLIELNKQLPIPITNHYATPSTLGKDRIAAIVGAQALFPNTPVLCIDAGTCITFDVLDAAGNYYGGAISPGLNLRFKALNTFTAKLPLLKLDNSYYELIGNSTQNSILSGVQNGTTAELDGIIQQYQALFPKLMTILTGGDALFFETRLKSKIFARPNLVLHGLNKILQHNAADFS